MKKILPLIFLLILHFNLQAQNKSDDFVIMFYNTENLFDTIDSKDTEDTEFTPGSEKHWNSERYQKKIENIAHVIAAVGDKSLPDIVGLAEIENKQVLEDLIGTDYLKKGNYGIVHEDSPDERGIDVALLYRKDRFDFGGYEKIPVSFPFDSLMTTRDILRVYGKLPDGEEINFYVNHWSSRYGGQKETEAKRMYCAVALRRSVDMLLTRDANAKIVIMGDFNDEPTNKSIMNVLQATNKRKNISVGEFYNLMYDKHNLSDTGSYYYRGSWNMLDQIMVTRNLLTNTSGYHCNYDSGKIFSEDWMMYTNKNGEVSPNRTYGGSNYFGGYSDHLPVYLILTK